MFPIFILISDETFERTEQKRIAELFDFPRSQSRIAATDTRIRIASKSAKTQTICSANKSTNRGDEEKNRKIVLKIISLNEK